MDVFDLLDQLKETIDEGGKVPLSSKIMVEKDEIEKIISDIRTNIPDEISSGKWLVLERERILSESNQESKQVVGQAKDLAESIIKNARMQEKEIIEDATSNSQQMIENAKKMREGYLEEDTIMKIAKERSNEIINNAQQKAENMKTAAYEYSDDMLLNLQKELSNLNDVINKNREAMSNMGK